MNNSRRILILFVVTSFLTASRTSIMAQGTNSAYGRKVLTVIDALAEAGIKRDIVTIDRLYSDDYFHTNADGSVMTKAQVIAHYKSPSGVTVESSRHDEDRIQVDANMAVLSCRVTVNGRDDEKAFGRTFRVTYVLRRQHGRWQVVASHASFIMR